MTHRTLRRPENKNPIWSTSISYSKCILRVTTL